MSEQTPEVNVETPIVDADDAKDFQEPEQKSDVDQLAEGLKKAATETAYATLKEALLVAGAAGHLDIRDMENRLRQGSLYRRAAEQLVKAQRHLLSLEAPDAHPLSDDRLEAIPG